MSDPAVDGSFTDDVTGLPAEHEHAPVNMNLSAQEVVDIQVATQLTQARLIDTLVAAGKYNWQAFGSQDGVGEGVQQKSCASYMTSRCAAQQTQPDRPMTVQFDAANAEQVGMDEDAVRELQWSRRHSECAKGIHISNFASH